MPKKNKTKKAPKARKVRKTNGIPQQKLVSNIRPNAPMRLGHVVSTCSILDPFCVHARGAQRPDGGPPTVPFQVRAVVPIDAITTYGKCRVAILPNPLFCYLGSSYTTYFTYSASASDIGGGSVFVAANAKELRITSFGVIIRSAMTATTAKGLIIASSDAQPIYSQNISPGSLQASESQVTTLAAGTELCWVSKPMSPSAHLFKPASSYTNTMSDFDWTSLVVEVSGGDASSGITYLTAEVVMNIEMTLGTATAGSTTNVGSAQLQRTPPKPNPVALRAADSAHVSRSSFVQGGIDAASSYLKAQANAALTDVMSYGMSALALL